MITPIYASVLGLLYFVLSVRVISVRRKGKISLGSGGNIILEKRIRAHANFAEYAPLVLLLMLCAELQNAPDWRLHLAGGLLLIGRVLHSYGVSQEEENYRIRVTGMACTFAALISSCFSNLL